MNKFKMPALFVIAVALALSGYICAFPGISYAGLKSNSLYLKRIYTSNNKGSSLIWFKFNRKPDSVVKKLNLNNYSIRLSFKNTESDMKSKFIKFKNRLFKAVEVIPNKNLGLDVVIYFDKNIKISKKDMYGTFYGSYFIIKVNHVFAYGIFKNIGKGSAFVKPGVIKSVKAKIKNTKFHINGGKLKLAAFPLSSFKATSKRAPIFNISFEIVKTAVYLALIIGLIYLVYFLMNKFKGRISQKEKTNNLKIISSINLGNKKSILLIDVNRELFLVGLSQSNIQVIGHIKSKSNGSGDNLGDNGNADINGRAIADESDNVMGYSSEDATPDTSPFIKSYGKFADILRNQVKTGNKDRFSQKTNTEKYQDVNSNDKSNAFKVENISNARFKNKADNVFFDIEERLKGLMENNNNENGNIKKF
ncbi:FliO/MopB family protein [Candidatus Acidulodesulfobacterium sp. H_13]|uniref:FliO/MopB family protein n=1 Tax=Candidatus Acidulodesulfobacterium sp. H_13 TaxID=3395470 RepID=UPI003AF84818